MIGGLGSENYFAYGLISLEPLVGLGALAQWVNLIDAGVEPARTKLRPGRCKFSKSVGVATPYL